MVHANKEKAIISDGLSNVAPPINQSCSKSKSICDLSFTYHSE